MANPRKPWADMPPDEREVWCECESDMRCPCCGELMTDSFEYRTDAGTADCGSCGAEFIYERHVEVTYTTEPIGGWGK